MRTIDATLKSELATGLYQAFFELLCMETFGGVVVHTFVDVTKFTLSPFGELNVEAAYGEATLDAVDWASIFYIRLRRGVVKDGIQYYLDTSDFSVQLIRVDGYYIKFVADVLPRKKLSLTADVSYWTIIQAFATDIGFTVTRKESAEAYWNNQFLPAGKILSLNTAAYFRTYLKQKYFMNLTDAGGNELIFWSAKNYASVSREYTITVPNLAEIDYYQGDNGLQYVGFLWRNDAGTIYQASSTQMPIYNLGYVKDGEPIPVGGTVTQASSAALFNKRRPDAITPLVLPINLEYLTGDYVTITSTEKNVTVYGYLLVEEYFDVKRSPSWGIKLSLWDYVANTEGGALPSTIERVAAYTPLVSTGFDGNLTPSVNNLQAFAQAVDDMSIAPAAKGVTNGDSHDHSGGDGAQIAYSTLSGLPTITNPPATTAANDVQVGNGAGAWIVKTLGQFVTILRTSLDSIYAATSGWSERSETWTRTGNHTFTVATDLTATFRKGMKVRYKQGGSFEYGVVGSSSYSAPNTTVTLITNDDYAMAAGAITDQAISPIENPEGFPNSFNYTPSLTCGGSMTIASSTINIAKWWTSGAICKFAVSIDVSFGGTANSTFAVSNPIAASVGAVAFAANCRDTGLGVLPVGTGTAGPTVLAFRKANVSNWTLAATSSVYGSGEYPF